MMSSEAKPTPGGAAPQMILEPAGLSAGMPASDQTLAVAAASSTDPRVPRNLEIAGQIERAYPGYHVWTSDAGWWYATRMHPWARGQSATVHGPGPGELSGALAEEEADTIGRAMAGAW
jgi:hypothetical protein